MSLAHPCTPFERIAARYIRYRHSMGYHFVSQASHIDILCRFLSARRARDLDEARFEAWSRSLDYLHGGARRAAQYIVYNL